MRKIVCATGSRAEYGLLRWLLKDLNDRDNVELELFVTGSHLSPKFGMTIDEIRSDGFTIGGVVDCELDTSHFTTITKAMSKVLSGFSEFIDRKQPDLVVVVGDRYEILSIATSCLVAGVPIAHIHGGETTEGAFDDAIRHSITKMSHLHFVAAKEYQDRVIQLGEDPENVFLVGGLGVDCIERIDFMTRAELEHELGFKLQDRNILVTFHPETIEGEKGNLNCLEEILNTVLLYPDCRFLFTGANADPEGEQINIRIRDFCSRNSNSFFIQSLGQRRYYSCLKHFTGVLGNSSSGLLEAPTFKIGTINVGRRQSGRLKAKSVIDCDCNSESMFKAIAMLFSDSFRNSLTYIENPYGSGGASVAIAEVVTSIPLVGITQKRFYNIKS